MEDKPVYNVRIDPELYEFYTQVAKDQGLSITAQINLTLGLARVQSKKYRHITTPTQEGKYDTRRHRRSRVFQKLREEKQSPDIK